MMFILKYLNSCNLYKYKEIKGSILSCIKVMANKQFEDRFLSNFDNIVRLLVSIQQDVDKEPFLLTGFLAVCRTNK